MLYPHRMCLWSEETIWALCVCSFGNIHTWIFSMLKILLVEKQNVGFTALLQYCSFGHASYGQDLPQQLMNYGMLKYFTRRNPVFPIIIRGCIQLSTCTIRVQRYVQKSAMQSVTIFCWKHLLKVQTQVIHFIRSGLQIQVWWDVMPFRRHWNGLWHLFL
jgi:hypothetical protein